MYFNIYIQLQDKVIEKSGLGDSNKYLQQTICWWYSTLPHTCSWCQEDCILEWMQTNMKLNPNKMELQLVRRRSDLEFKASPILNRVALTLKNRFIVWTWFPTYCWINRWQLWPEVPVTSFDWLASWSPSWAKLVNYIHKGVFKNFKKCWEVFLLCGRLTSVYYPPIFP